MKFEQDFMARLTEVKAARGLSRLAEQADIDQGNLSRALGKQRQQLGLDKVSRILDAMGAKVVFPEAGAPADLSREVCFVSAKVVNAEAGAPPVAPEDYLAVPLVEEVGAGPGIIPQGQLKSWFLVWRHQPAVRNKSDFIAVEIARGSTSMSPTLNPGDIVLVCRSDTEVATGRMYLVTDPDGAGKVKRVSVQRLPRERDYRITFYSDNAAENPPEVYSLNQDFSGDWNRVVVGRVVWAWSDVSGK